jgi:predicted dehydrogenase
MTRRDILFGAAAIATRGRILGANDRINTAHIGLGGRGTWLLELLLKHQKAKPDVQVAGLCDVYRKRLTHASSLASSARTYLHHQELLERSDIDAVFIATPDHWHAPITLDALARGKDVYVEKPMTHTAEEAAEVARRAAGTKRIVQVGVQGTSWKRWHTIRDLVQSGELGKIVAVQGTYSRNDPGGDWNWPIDAGAGPNATGEDYIDWKQWLGPAPARPFDADRFFRFRKYWDYSGGIATDLHYHVVAPFHVALDNDHPARICGMGGLWVYGDGREVPDTFLTAADYPGKYSLTIQSSQVNSIGPVMLLRGTKATLHLGDEWEGPKNRDTDFATLVAEPPFLKEFISRHGKDEVTIPNVGNEGDLKHIDNFIECVGTRQQPNCHADMGWKVMSAIDLSVRSYRQGKVFHCYSDGRIL